MNTMKRWYYDRIATWAIVLKKPEIAYEYWQKILDEHPNDPQVLAMRAHQRAQDGDESAAIAEFENLVNLDAKNAANWFNYGFLLQKNNAHEKAIHALKKAIDLNPKLDQAWFGLGLSQVACGENEKAAESFKANTKMQPMSPHGFYELAKVQFAMNDTDACEKTMRKVKQFDPKVAAQLEDETGIQIGVDRWWARR